MASAKPLCRFFHFNSNERKDGGRIMDDNIRRFHSNPDPPKEGELYRIMDVEGVQLHIFYGYYHPESERGVIDPMPIYPDFTEAPMYTREGYPLVNADQPICPHFFLKPSAYESDEGWCNDCVYLELYDACLGVCRCKYNRKRE